MATLPDGNGYSPGTLRYPKGNLEAIEIVTVYYYFAKVYFQKTKGIDQEMVGFIRIHILAMMVLFNALLLMFTPLNPQAIQRGPNRIHLITIF